MALAAFWSVALSVPGFSAFALQPTARTFWRWVGAWGRLILGGSGIRVEREGSMPPGPAVIVANHQAMIDIPALLIGLDRPFVFVARAELRRIPIVGLVLQTTPCVFIDRGGAGPGLEEAAARVAEGDAVLMFPEGTRNYGGPVGRFRSGAFRLALAAGVPVVPVAIDGGPAVLNEREKTAHPGAVRVRILPPVHALPDEPARAFAERARSAVAAALA